MKLSEFILENVKKIQDNPLDRSKYSPHFLFYNDFNYTDKVVCRICVAGYMRAVEERINDPICYTDVTLDFCRTGDWSKVCYRLNIDASILVSNPVPAPGYSDFMGWEEFDKHIESLKERALALKEIGL